jgi:hypothetical protein
MNKIILFLSLLLLLFIVAIICISYYINIKGFEKYSNKKNAIVVLTKGYELNEDYGMLISRNEAIYEKYYNLLDNPHDYDVIIFHEGNISIDQQRYIQLKTPKLPLIFTEVSFYNKTPNNPKCPNTDLSNAFSNGYKNMCYFWSISFLKYLDNYEYIIRIDEDCIINKFNPSTIDNYKNLNIMFSSAEFQKNDALDVTVGMNELFQNYIQTTNMTQKNDLSMPYTNFMIVNVPFFNNNLDVTNILTEIDKSDCIFSNRWGDLPIWGYILSYFIDKTYYLEDRSISYIHGSHSATIN